MWVMASSFLRFLDHTQRCTTVGRTPLVEWSARRRDLHLTTHNTHNRLISMPLVGFEPTISAGEQPQTYALDHAPTGTGTFSFRIHINLVQFARTNAFCPSMKHAHNLSFMSRVLSDFILSIPMESIVPFPVLYSNWSSPHTFSIFFQSSFSVYLLLTLGY